MSEDDIQGYLESEDAFTQSAASAWDGSREELGEKKGDIIELETGRKIGSHNGYWFHTIGQRKGVCGKAFCTTRILCAR